MPATPLPPALHAHRIVLDKPGRTLVGLLTDRLIRCGVRQNVVDLENDVRAWINNWNQDPKPSIWTKTVEDIVWSLSKYISKISDAGH